MINWNIIFFNWNFLIWKISGNTYTIQHLKKLLPSFPNWHPFLAFSLLEIKMCIYSFLFTLSLLAKNYSVQFIPALQWLTINTIAILYRYSSSFQNWVYPPWVIFTPYHLPNQEPLSALWSLFRSSLFLSIILIIFKNLIYCLHELIFPYSPIWSLEQWILLTIFIAHFAHSYPLVSSYIFILVFSSIFYFPNLELLILSR